MKVLLTTVCAVILLSACASTKDVSQWQGESLSSLIEAYGPPATFLKLDDGNTVVEFNRHQNNIAGNFCTLSFMVDRSNTVLGGSGLGTAATC